VEVEDTECLNNNRKPTSTRNTRHQHADILTNTDNATQVTDANMLTVTKKLETTMTLCLQKLLPWPKSQQNNRTPLEEEEAEEDFNHMAEEEIEVVTTEVVVEAAMATMEAMAVEEAMEIEVVLAEVVEEEASTKEVEVAVAISKHSCADFSNKTANARMVINAHMLMVKMNSMEDPVECQDQMHHKWTRTK